MEKWPFLYAKFCQMQGYDVIPFLWVAKTLTNLFSSVFTDCLSSPNLEMLKTGIQCFVMAAWTVLKLLCTGQLKLLHIPAVKNRQHRYEVYSWGEDAIENFLNVFTINCLYWMASVVICKFFAFLTDLQHVRRTAQIEFELNFFYSHTVHRLN